MGGGGGVDCSSARVWAGLGLGFGVWSLFEERGFQRDLRLEFRFECWGAGVWVYGIKRGGRAVGWRGDMGLNQKAEGVEGVRPRCDMRLMAL